MTITYSALIIHHVDINTMTPAHDASEATAILGAGLLAEALGVLAANRA